MQIICLGQHVVQLKKAKITVAIRQHVILVTITLLYILYLGVSCLCEHITFFMCLNLPVQICTKSKITAIITRLEQC